MRRCRCLILSVLMIMLLANRAEALSCTASIGSPVVFSGLDILSGAPVDASSTLDVTCTVTSVDGLLGALLTITVCPNIGAGSGGAVSGTRRLALGVNTLNYNIYQDAGHTVPWGHVSFPDLGTVPPTTMTVTVPPLFQSNQASVSRTIYFRLFGSQQTAPPGLYTSSFAGAHTNIVSGIGLLGCPGLYVLPSTTTAPFTVQANITKNCTVTTQSVNFGSVGILAANVDATGHVRVTCTKSTDYSVALSVGSFTPTTRRMVKGSEFITYGLYRDISRTQPWGDTVATMPPSAAGSGLTDDYSVYGRVLPQTTPSAGTYNDTVVVTITY